MKTGKFYCLSCGKKVYLKNRLKNEQKIECFHCGFFNLVRKENGKVKPIREEAIYE